MFKKTNNKFFWTILYLFLFIIIRNKFEPTPRDPQEGSSTNMHYIVAIKLLANFIARSELDGIIIILLSVALLLGIYLTLTAIIKGIRINREKKSRKSAIFESLENFTALLIYFWFTHSLFFYFYWLFISKYGSITGHTSSGLWIRFSALSAAYLILILALFVINNHLKKSHFNGKNKDIDKVEFVFSCPNCNREYKASIEYCLSCKSVINNRSTPRYTQNKYF